ncbi:MAG: 50S ribosomal protein L30e [Thermoprotei archaeon]|nr:MAG: 50S ribosomal protein L30e [Thermoprotei archaeon]RLF19310.1 MAG: 50S ribosomal protein L30e [Thermoprotei archaeon]
MIDLARELQTVMRTGKVIIGFKKTLNACRFGKAKLVIVALNAPSHIKEDIMYYAKLSGIPVYVYPGSSWDLGALCRKPFMVSSLAIIDPGESNIMALVEKPESKEEEEEEEEEVS